MTRHQEEVGRCEGCGRFWLWSEMGHMLPDGSLVFCRKCARKHSNVLPNPEPQPEPVRVVEEHL